MSKNNIVFGEWGRHLACLNFITGRQDACPTTHHCLESGAGILPAWISQAAGKMPAPLLTTILILDEPLHCKLQTITCEYQAF